MNKPQNPQDNNIDEVEAGGQDLAVIEHGKSLAAILQGAEIDQQVTTAKRYPRSVTSAVRKLTVLACLDKQTALEGMYALPRGKKTISGPSIRFAEAAMQCWGNSRCDARVTHVDRDEGYVEAEGVFWDLEENSRITKRTRRNILDRRGQVYNDDMITMTGNAACSIAARNAILAGIPKGVWRGAFDEACKVVIGDVKEIATTRAEAVKAFEQFGVKPEQVFVALGVKGGDDISLEHILTLRGMFAALKNQEATVDEMFDARKGGKSFDKVENPLAEPKSQSAAESADSPQAEGAPVTPVSRAPGEAAGSVVVPPPINQAEYGAYCAAYIAAATDGDALLAKFDSEKSLRNKCNILPEVIDDLRSAVRAVAKTLKEKKPATIGNE